MPGRRGIVLILVAALLSLLALVAAVLMTATRAGRGLTRSHILRARALLLTRSGVERAVQGIARNPLPSAGGDPFDDWTFRDPPGTPLADAANPSLHHPRLEPWLDDGDGVWEGEGFSDRNGNRRYDGFSGRLRGALHAWGDTYTLRIDDDNAKINVNGGFLDAEDRDNDTIPDHRDPDVRTNPADPKDRGRGWNYQLARILDVLGTAREDSEDWDADGALDPAPIGIAGLGQAILANRPRGGYGSVEALRETLAGALGPAVPDLSPYLTVSSWTDPAVVHPNEYADSMSYGSISLSELMMRRKALAVEEGGRPPVNLNRADPHVLAALVTGLLANTYHAAMPRMTITTGGSTTFGTPPDDRVARVVGAIVSRRRTDPFDTWGEFARFCDGLSQTGVVAPRTDDLLEANFNPNTMLAKTLPDQLMCRRVDKTDFLVWSTEGSLTPLGAFRIESLGRVAGDGGIPEASAHVATATRAFHPVRHTTQRDFVAGRVPDATADSYLSLADRAWRTHGAGASWNGWEPGRGLAVTTYPSPMTALPGNACDLDGSVALATTEYEPIDFSAGKPLLFLHHFDDSWNADLGGATVRTAATTDGNRLQPDLSAPVWPDPSLPGLQKEPNTLLPDGIRGDSGWGRSVVIPVAGNLPSFGGTPVGNRGVVSYWVKVPAYPRDYGRDGIHVGAIRKTGSYTQTINLGNSCDMWGIQVENWASGNDIEHEQVADVRMDGATEAPAYLPSLPWGMRWHLVTGAFDTNETVVSLQTWVRVGAVRPHGPVGWTMYDRPISRSSNQDLLGDGTWLVPHRLSSLTVDELATHDLGDDAVQAQNDASVLHEDRLDQGRYYKGDDGAFLSAVVEPDPEGPSRIVLAQWTTYRPSETRLEYLDGVAGIPDVGQDRVVDPALRNARVEVDLVDDATPATLRTLAQGAPVGVTRARFRYRVRFVNGLTELGLDPLNQGVLETPWFDDITFLCQPARGPRLVSWLQD